MSATDDGSDTPSDLSALLQAHAEHVFVCTRAGKPVFTLHGDACDVGPVVASLVALTSFALPPARGAGAEAGGNSGNSGSSGGSSAGARLQSCSSVVGGCVIDVCVLQAGEVVLAAVRRRGQSEPGPGPAAAQDEMAAALRAAHAQLLTGVPNLDEVLRLRPGIDLRGASALVGECDWQALRQLLAALPFSAALAFGAVPTVGSPLLSVPAPRFLQTLLARATRAHYGPSALLALLYCRGAVLAVAEGPAAAAAGQRMRQQEAAGGGHSARAHAGLCGGALRADDYVLLEHLLCGVARRAHGAEAWVPLCLPHLEPRGFLWCHVASLSAAARAAQGRSAAARHFNDRNALASRDYGGERGLLLVQLSYSQEDFPALSAAAAGVLGGLAGAGRPCLTEELEAEAAWRRDRTCGQLFTQLLFPPPAGAAPGSGDGGDEDEAAAAAEMAACPLAYFALTLRTHAVERAGGNASVGPAADVLLSDAAPGSPLHDLWKRPAHRAAGADEEEMEGEEATVLAPTRALVRSALAQLSGAARPPLVLLQEDADGGAALALRPHRAALATLFNSLNYREHKPRAEGLPCAERRAPLPLRGSAVEAHAERCVREMVLVFAPQTPKADMLYWAARTLHMLQARAGVLELLHVSAAA